MHVNEINNRLLKAQRLLAYIDKSMPGASAATLSLLNDESWAHIATKAGEKTAPSKSTVMTIIAMVRGREIAVDAIRASLATPQGRAMSGHTI